MYKPSRLEMVSIMLITLNLVGINIIVLLKKIKAQNIFKSLFNSSDAERKSQMDQAIEKEIIKVAIHDKTAYWVLNNVIYRASVNEDGKIEEDDAEEIDVFKLSEKEVGNLLFILDSMND